MPQEVIPQIKIHLNSIYFAPCEKSAYRETEAFKQKYGSLYPSAVKSFEEDFPACIQHLKCPASHRRSITSTNLVERSFLEEKRRSNTTPCFFNEKSGLKLIFASLIRASQRWKKLKFSFEDQVKIIELRHKRGHKAGKEPKISKSRIPHEQKFFFQKK